MAPLAGKNASGKAQIFFFLKASLIFFLKFSQKMGNQYLKLEVIQKIMIPTPGTFSNPNPNDNIPRINIEITTPKIDPDPP